jgi:L-iditol 2-dehydrogenase
VAVCGVCASELELWGGSDPVDFPLYLGHEVSGRVVDAGPDVVGLSVGDAVGVWVTARGFGEYVAVRAEHCRPSGDVPLDLVLAEPLACAVNAVDLADVRLGDDVVLIGAGFMGNLVQELVGLRGARSVVVADTRPDALDKATQLGATRTVLVTEESLPDVVAEVTGGRGADITFECTGTQAGLSGVGDVTRMSGKIALVGYHQGGTREIPLGYWNWMAFQIVNGHFREPATILRGMTRGLRLVTAGALPIAPLVTHRFALERIDEAFCAARDKPPGFVKAVVVVDAAGTTDDGDLDTGSG